MKGFDQSHWNADIDYNKAKDEGFSFVFLKATEANNFRDPKFFERFKAAKAAGLKVGAYCFAQPGKANAKDTFDYFKNTIADMGADYIMLDLEVNGGLDGAGVRAWAKAWLTLAQAAFAKKPLLYSFVDFIKQNELSQLQDACDLFLADYADGAPRLSGFKTLAFRQTTSKGTVAGVSPIDLDVTAQAGAPATVQEAGPKEAPKPKPTASTNTLGGRVYYVEKGDTLSGIGGRFNVPYKIIQRWNHIKDANVIQKGQKLYIPRPHRVKSGEILSRLTSDWKAVAKANGINPDVLHVGQKIYLP